jgi:hypothetical protein
LSHPAFDALGAAAALAAMYLALAYLVLPALWSHYEHEPGLKEVPMRTTTKEGIPGDPLNVGLVGTAEELVRAVSAAGWSPADPITLKTSIEIAGSVLFDRPDPYAPVSNLFYEGRRQDLAFERPFGRSADQRHHVRFWRVLDAGKDGRPVWLGAATFDRGVGLSRFTGQITHHIAADVDAERDRLIADLTRAGYLSQIYTVSGIGPTLRARNGGGDLFHTDGDVWVGVLTPGAVASMAEPPVLASPPGVAIKNRAWTKGKEFLRTAGWLPE